jgi:hypothetical protein
MFCNAWRNWPAKSLASHLPSPVQPIWPAMKTSRPLGATTPFEKPRGFAQPGGCRNWVVVLMGAPSSA